MAARGYDYSSGTSDIEIASPVSFRNITIYPTGNDVTAYIGSNNGAVIAAGASLTITDMGAIGNVLIERPLAAAVKVVVW